jgi:hypothetical protein
VERRKSPNHATAAIQESSMSTATDPLVITSLEIENVKRIKVLRVRPDGAVVTIAGRNAQGKSSCLDAIEMAIGGAGSIPEAPIRMGARSARIVADLGEIVVERTMSAKGTKLEVRAKDGAILASPQKILDQLCSAISFDPMRFTRMKPTEQDATLKQVLGLDFAEIDRQRQAAYDERTRANKSVKELEARLNAAPEHRDAPATEVSVAELTAELTRRQGEERKQATLASAAAAAERAVEISVTSVTEKEAAIVELERKLAQTREFLAGARDFLDVKRAEAKAAAAELEAFEVPDPAEITAQLATVEETNRKVRANAERANLAKDLASAEERAQLLDDAIIDIDDEKAAKLAAAKFPIEGLAFDESGPTLNGVPLAQASTAQKIRLSVALGFALNPRLRVLLIREGSALDDDSLKLLAELATEAGGQLWIEKVSSTGEGCSVVLVDGEIAGGSYDDKDVLQVPQTQTAE